MGMSVLGGALMGALGERLAERDVAIGMVLSASLGVGLLFLNFFTTGAAGATSLLFGNLLGVSVPVLWRMAAAGALTLCGLAAISRKLLLASVRPELAEAAGLNLRLVSVLFLALTGLAVAEAVQAVGVLLVFTLLVGPAASAHMLARSFWPGLAMSVLLAALQACLGVALAYWTDWPSSFWISMLSGSCYLLASVTEWRR